MLFAAAYRQLELVPGLTFVLTLAFIQQQNCDEVPAFVFVSCVSRPYQQVIVECVPVTLFCAWQLFVGACYELVLAFDGVESYFQPVACVKLGLVDVNLEMSFVILPCF